MLAVGASFTGAALAFAGARLGSRQSEGASRREEWGRRFTFALESVQGSDERSRRIGRALLGELAGSELATDEERGLARALLIEDVTFDPAGADLRALPADLDLDATLFLEDDGSTSSGGAHE